VLFGCVVFVLFVVVVDDDVHPIIIISSFFPSLRLRRFRFEHKGSWAVAVEKGGGKVEEGLTSPF
jgi:hypothetical protein